MQLLEWIKSRDGLLSLFGLASIAPVHLAIFTYAMPEQLRHFIDLSFKLNFSTNFFLFVLLSAFFARYIPMGMIGIAYFLFGERIDRIYYQRGYRSAYVSYTGVGDKARSYEKLDDIRRHFERVRHFGRNEARLENFKKGKFEAIVPVRFYEKNRTIITLFLATALFGYHYVGLVSTVLCLLIQAFAAVSAIAYENLRRSKFFLNRDWWDQQISQSRKTTEPTLDKIAVLIFAALIASAWLGSERASYLRSAAPVMLSTDASSAYRLIGSTASGIILFDQGAEVYFFLAYERLPKIVSGPSD